MATTRLLIVEGHGVLRELLTTAFEDDPEVQVVGVAADGSEALSVQRLVHPTVVLVDSLAVDLIDIGPVVRELAQSADPPEFVVLGTSLMATQLNEALEAGAIGFVLRDASVAELVAAVHEAGRRRPFVPKRVTAAAGERLQFDIQALTARERGVLRLVAEGLANKEIALELGLAEGTVKNHVAAILGKLNARSRAHAAALSHIAGLASPSDDA